MACAFAFAWWPKLHDYGFTVGGFTIACSVMLNMLAVVTAIVETSPVGKDHRILFALVPSCGLPLSVFATVFGLLEKHPLSAMVGGSIMFMCTTVFVFMSKRNSVPKNTYTVYIIVCIFASCAIAGSALARRYQSARFHLYKIYMRHFQCFNSRISNP